VGKKHEEKPAYNKTHDKKKYFGEVLASKIVLEHKNIATTRNHIVYVQNTKNKGRVIKIIE
jgi:hypothetical protein